LGVEGCGLGETTDGLVGISGYTIGNFLGLRGYEWWVEGDGIAAIEAAREMV
jgi:hypothetical protein